MNSNNKQAVAGATCATAKTGTREWSDQSYNIAKGCPHQCHYCYAWAIASRFCGATAPWGTMEVQPHKIASANRRFKGVVMFPTSHDLTPDILPEALATLRNLLGAGNEVLVVSKPHLSVIKTLCGELATYRDHVEFRFTIGSLSAKTCALWEPGAPPPSERLEALKYAFQQGWETSVSMEPMLGPNDEMIRLVATVKPYISNTIWLGKMNRLIWQVTPTPELLAAKAALRAAQSDANIRLLVSALRNEPKVRWKDSIKAVIGKGKPVINGGPR